MPEILSHVSFGDKVYRKLANRLPLSKVDYISGNLIPDLTNDKGVAHYYVPTGIKGVLIPDIEKAKKDLLVYDDSVKLGMFSHIYLDYRFIKDFLIPSFNWDTENDIITSTDNDTVWSTSSFFSEKGLYGSYTKSNKMMLHSQRISLITIAIIPETLPDSGLSTFDSRREKKWIAELREYLSLDPNTYQGDMLDISALWDFIDDAAESFISCYFPKWL